MRGRGRPDHAAVAGSLRNGLDGREPLCRDTHGALWLGAPDECDRLLHPQQLIIASQGPDSILKKAVGGDWKGKVSPVLYTIAIPLAFVSEWISLGLYVLVALIWLVPDRRIEHVLASQEA